MRFRKKPVVVEAEQYLRGVADPRGVCRCNVRGGEFNRHIQYPNSPAHVHTIHDGQVCMLEHGDWVIAEPDGEHFYPVKPGIFEAIYEPDGFVGTQTL